MFRETRRPRQALSKEEIVEILEKGETCVMAVNGDEGYPYAVPLNYAYKDDKIYFHCATEGHKIDSIKRNDKVSFCVIVQSDVNPQKLNTDFISVIAFGRAREVTNDQEKMDALHLIGEKFSASFPEEVKDEIKMEWDRVAIVEVSIEHITGKIGSSMI